MPILRNDRLQQEMSETLQQHSRTWEASVLDAFSVWVSLKGGSAPFIGWISVCLPKSPSGPASGWKPSIGPLHDLKEILHSKNP